MCPLPANRWQRIGPVLNHAKKAPVCDVWSNQGSSVLRQEGPGQAAAGVRNSVPYEEGSVVLSTAPGQRLKRRRLLRVGWLHPRQGPGGANITAATTFAAHAPDSGCAFSLQHSPKALAAQHLRPPSALQPRGGEVPPGTPNQQPRDRTVVCRAGLA